MNYYYWIHVPNPGAPWEAMDGHIWNTGWQSADRQIWNIRICDGLNFAEKWFNGLYGLTRETVDRIIQHECGYQLVTEERANRLAIME